MKVAQLVRLTSKDSKGFFIKEGNKEILRNKVAVEESVILEKEQNYQECGLLYIVDEKATEERNKVKLPKKAKTTKKEEVVYQTKNETK